MGGLNSLTSALISALVIVFVGGVQAAPTADSVDIIPIVTDSLEQTNSDPSIKTTVDSSKTKSLDTLYYIPEAFPSKVSLLTNPIDFEDHLKQRPTAALFKSMIVPGWGQLGNRSYFKAAVFIGLEGWLISNAVHFKNRASDKYEQYQATDDSLSLQRDAFYDEYQDQRSLRNKYTWFAGLTIFISMFDAYVDAHLSGAPDKVNQSRVGFDMRPDRSGGFQASLSMSF